MFDVDEPISDYQKAIRVLRLKTLLQQYDDAKVSDQQHSSFPSNPVGALDGHVMSPQRSYLPNPEELTPLLNNNLAVVQHLEGQVDFYKNALEALKRQTELVVSENETLFDQLKTQAVAQVLAADKQSEKDQSSSNNKGDTSQNHTQRGSRSAAPVSGAEDDDEEIAAGTAVGATDQKVGTARGGKDTDRGRRVEEDQDPGRWSVRTNVSLRTSFQDSVGAGALDSQLFLSAKEKRFVVQLEEEVEKIRKLHEAKTKHLESLLYSTRDELEDYQRQVSELQAKARAQQVLAEQPALCIKCGHRSAMLSGTHSEAAMDTINKLTRERDDLLNTLTGQKAVLAEVRQREFEAYNQVKKSCHMVEQAQLEKAEAIIHVHQLREDLQSERQRHDKYMKSSSEKMEKECDKVRAACREEVDAVVRQVESSNEARSALENQLERVTREKVDFASELEQAKSQIMAHASEMSQVGENVHKELEQTLVKYSMASQEISSLKTAAQQAAREREQERARLAGEMEGLRRRLNEAEHGWMESKEECITLTEKLNKAEWEAKSAIVAKEKLEKTREEDMDHLSKQSSQREEQLTTLLQQTEIRHTQCRTELQQMLESEIQVCNQMKEECKKLTQQLQDSSDKSRAKVLDSKQECNKMKVRLEECRKERLSLEEQNARKDKVIQELSAKVKRSDENARKQINQMCQLLATRNALMKERKVLSREVEFLRKQWLAKRPPEPVTPVETGSNASTEEAGLPAETGSNASIEEPRLPDDEKQSDE